MIGILVDPPRAGSALAHSMLVNKSSAALRIPAGTPLRTLPHALGCALHRSWHCARPLLSNSVSGDWPRRNQVWRAALLRRGADALAQTLKALQPVSLIALLATLVLLFGFQGEQILDQPLIIAMLAVPILIQVYFNAGLAYLLNRQLGVAHCVAAPSALIGASNFFELAVATAIVLFGFNAGAALATVVGVLVEVPVMLSVVRITMRTKEWYRAGGGDAHAGRFITLGDGMTEQPESIHALMLVMKGAAFADRCMNCSNSSLSFAARSRAMNS